MRFRLLCITLLFVTIVLSSNDIYADSAEGTAFFITSDGYLLTCAHVVKDASKIDIVVGNRTLSAAIIDIDEKNDVALLKTEVTGQATIPISNTGTIASGSKVWVLGFPLASVLGESLKVNSGSVSGFAVQGTQRIIQIDAAVNPGNSGGPLLNESGVVVGIVNAKIVGPDVSGVGFAIPTNYAMKLLRDQDLSPSSKKTDTVLDGPALTKIATPAIALVRATVRLKEPKLIKSIPTGRCSSVSFSKDGKTIVCVGYKSNKATIWEISTATAVKSFEGLTRADFGADVPPEMESFIKCQVSNGVLRNAVFTPDGLFIAGGSQGCLKVWDIVTGECVNVYQGGLFVTRYAFSANGIWLLYHSRDFLGSDIKCLNTKTNEETLLPNTRSCDAFSISPNKNIVAVYYGEWSNPSSKKGTVEILELPTGKLLRKITGTRASIMSIDFSPDGRLIAGIETDTMPWPLTTTEIEMLTGIITIWNSSTGSVVKTIRCPGVYLQELQYSPDGKMLAVSVIEVKKYLKDESIVDSVWLYDTTTCKRIAALPGSLGFFGSWAGCRIFSPDSKYLALIRDDSKEQNVKIWQVR